MLFSFADGFAQVSDTLKEVKIKARRDKKVSTDERVNTYAPGQTIVTIDSVTLEQYKYQSMANLLSQQVPVFVKSYGLNNIATLNFRGSSAAQSQVYWNGIPIQNAALGISDVSLLPVSLMNNVNVVYGSSSALWGSGNVGGALLVENNLPEYNNDAAYSQSVSAVAASFGHYRFGVKSQLTDKKFSLGLQVHGETAQNDFRYEKSGESLSMTNAALHSGVGLLQARYHVNDKNIVSAKIWYQQYYREVPPALFESLSVKNQRDESLRTLLQWDRKTNKSNQYLKVSYIRDMMLYQDSVVSLDTKNIVNQSYVEAGLNYRFNTHHKLLLFAPVQISWIDRVSLNDTKSQNRAALAGAYLLTTLNYKLDVSFNLRGEVINDLSVLLPGINASYRITDWLKLKGNIQRTYRIPTLNELYYQPGGNASLKPEDGWAEDVGYEVDVRGKLSVKHSLSFYNRVIDNWILWYGGAIWTPHNVATVHSRGLQTENRLEYKLKSVTLRLGVNAGYTLATTTSSYLPNDGSIGKQIPYTPRLNAQLNAGLIYKRVYFNYNYTYTGLRYITSDESYSLSAYQISNVQLMYTAPLGDNRLQVMAQCNNILNSDYQVVNARPMPGINWLTGVSWSF